MRVDLTVSGPDAAELAALLKMPSLGSGTWGWRGILKPAADLRVLRIRELQGELGLELTVAVIEV